MDKVSCGIDFGTSNTCIGLVHQGKVTLAPLEEGQYTIPSAIFYQRGIAKPFLGREAINLFFQGKEGRLMRSLKRILGTSFMENGTAVNGKVMKFEDIIAALLQHVKQQAEQMIGEEISHVVMGRPVHFIDDDPGGDGRAQQALENIARQIGFQHIHFQLEPIAAAFAHEVNVREEKLALVAVIGGGTSDFTIIRLSKDLMQKANRHDDILANTGVRIGGNDFDKSLSLAAIMPALGYGSSYGNKGLEVPSKPYHDLAEWSKVNLLYNVKLRSQVQQILYEAHDKVKYQKLLKVLRQEKGHALLSSTEEAKIALTQRSAWTSHLPFIEDNFAIKLLQSQMDEAIASSVESIFQAANACLKQAQIQSQDIQLIILTGGSTEVPAIQAGFRARFPQALIADEHKLSSVGLGLAYDCRNRFS